jgi:ornithine cyclodeaminase
MPFRFLTEGDVRRMLPASEFPALVALMESTLVDFSAGRVTQPVRSAVPVGPPGQYLGVMPALLANASALGTKLVSVVPGNSARGLSTHLGIVTLFDPETGALQAVMDARYVTEVRTAAVSSVSARRMARPRAPPRGDWGGRLDQSLAAPGDVRAPIIGVFWAVRMHCGAVHRICADRDPAI